MKCGAAARKEAKAKNLSLVETAKMVKDKGIKEIVSPEIVTNISKGGKLEFASATCPDCNTKMSKIIGKATE